jgi:hypothetical protein
MEEGDKACRESRHWLLSAAPNSEDAIISSSASVTTFFLTPPSSDVAHCAVKSTERLPERRLQSWRYDACVPP